MSEGLALKPGDVSQPKAGFIPRSLGIALVGILLVVPCFWQSRIQAGDLASHAYNAWMASCIAEGQAPGLWITRQWNNVLFDLLLVFLYSHIGIAAAQRIAVAAAVLIFASGAIRFISRGRNRNPWFVIPCAAMLAYGFVFHLGFFNFQIAMGICLWYLAIFLSSKWLPRLLFAPLLILAWIAHPLPVVWVVGLAVYAGIAEHLPFRQRSALFLAGLALLVAGHLILAHHYQTFWSLGQVVFVPGANQLLLFGDQYVVPFALLLGVWIWLLRRFVKQRTLQSLLSDIYLHLWALTAAAVVIVPAAVAFPQYARPFSYITTRLSMSAGILLCALLSQVPLRSLEKAALLGTAIVFFAFVFHDARRLNRMEDHVGAAVRAFPVGSRVIGLFLTTSARANPLWHFVDRPCIGRCFSYGNYEPASRQFRIRAADGNGIVMSDYADVYQVETGKYRVQARDLPLFLVYSCGPVHDQVCSRELHAGEAIGSANQER